jgi:hypothetical protein
MQGNSEVREKFHQKKKDSSQEKFHRDDRAWRKKRQNRHNTE